MSVFPVVLRCPTCRHTWLAATVNTAAWYAAGVTPRSIAKLWYCPKCRAVPPMGVEMADETTTEKTGGQLIEFRVRRKVCIRCGMYPALDAPYLCGDCEKELAAQAKATRDK